MLQETREAPARVAELRRADVGAYRALADDLAARPPAFAATVARGSSDHAATYAASLLGIACGLVTASIPPSLITRYGAALALKRALVIAISQSGVSPDIVATLRAATAAGGCTVAIVNAPGAPLAGAARHVLPQRAGPERSVAATKSFICSLVCVARLIAIWRGEGPLAAALERLPERLEAALACDWSAAVPLHAEALSAAEVHHGPRAVIEKGFPVLALALDDPAGRDAAAFAAELADSGHTVAVASAAPVAGYHLPLPPPLHPLLDPIVAVRGFLPPPPA